MDKPLLWMHGEVKSPPFSPGARVEAGILLRRLQHGERLMMHVVRPMPEIGPRCYELRIDDREARITWRVVYRVDRDAIVIAEVFAKKSQKTPGTVIDVCRLRFRHYDRAARG